MRFMETLLSDYNNTASLSHIYTTQRALTQMLRGARRALFNNFKPLWWEREYLGWVERLVHVRLQIDIMKVCECVCAALLHSLAGRGSAAVCIWIAALPMPAFVAFPHTPHTSRESRGGNRPKPQPCSTSQLCTISPARHPAPSAAKTHKPKHAPKNEAKQREHYGAPPAFHNL